MYTENVYGTDDVVLGVENVVHGTMRNVVPIRYMMVHGMWYMVTLMNVHGTWYMMNECGTWYYWMMMWYMVLYENVVHGTGT